MMNKIAEWIVQKYFVELLALERQWIASMMLSQYPGETMPSDEVYAPVRRMMNWRLN